MTSNKKLAPARRVPPNLLVGLLLASLSTSSIYLGVEFRRQVHQLSQAEGKTVCLEQRVTPERPSSPSEQGRSM
jgi:hypothetical protein